MSNGPQQFEVGVRGFKNSAVPSGTRGDYDVGDGDGDPSPARATGDLVRITPHVVIDCQIGQDTGEIVENTLLPGSSRTVPELELDDRTPAGLAGAQRSLNATANRRVAVAPQQMDPRRRVNEDHPTSSPATLFPQFVHRQEVPARARMLEQIRHPMPLVVIRDGRHDRLPFGPGVGKPHCIFQFALGNINGGLHTSILV